MTVTAIQPVAPSFIRTQIDTLLADIAIAAIKIGMIGTGPAIETVAAALNQPPGSAVAHVVLDPVMIAKGGASLQDRNAVSALREALLPCATVLTPNLPEAGELLAARAPETLKEMRRAAERLREIMTHAGARWVLLKGGHLPAAPAIDLLFDGDRMIELEAPRIATRNTHGTGCTLSAALAALLPQAPDVPTAARRAKVYLTAALRRADELAVGRGQGPVFHFPNQFPAPST
jgi:hydroxymethylpyrimidine/phosphomethylpyrimidine kinase